MFVLFCLVYIVVIDDVFFCSAIKSPRSGSSSSMSSSSSVSYDLLPGNTNYNNNNNNYGSVPSSSNNNYYGSVPSSSLAYVNRFRSYFIRVL